ncbi:hypothetical protein B5X24_HaOG205334 [Helicoverpa armigera]|uniref:Ionotropic glutamate receptor C-terminal domain-containing protein n=1 Tax=Helicoverpa armigera TaxID=29058 RepID=A0A2W1BLD1_HELAM|nr:hypothetical protein B5X24_HaOG205334 [Helicoverpa armigera]
MKKYDAFTVPANKDGGREAINLAIVNLKKEDFITKLWRKWATYNKKPDCEMIKDEETTITEMTLSQVAGIFYVLVGGLALALGVALVEFCQHGRAEAARANVPLRAALRAKARLASRTERKTPPQRTQGDHERLGWNGAAFAGYNDFLLGREMLGSIHRKIY